MSSPLIWIGLPGLAAAILWIFRRHFGRVVLFSTLLCLLLAVLAWLIPFGAVVRIGPLSFTIDTTLSFAGRSLTLDSSSRTFLGFIYVLCAFWFAGSYAAGIRNLLVPVGLGVVALLVAALAVEPFLYAAMLIEVAVLLSVPLLMPPGKTIGQGVLRFLIFQTLGMPFILLAGWALAGVETNPSSVTLVTLSSVFFALGFAFWLAVFPFYTWIPLLAEQCEPYVSGFIFLVLPTVDLLLFMNFLNRFAWLRATPEIFRIITMAGTLMIVTAGIWAIFQKDLARLFGYGVIVETGFSLLSIGLAGSIGTGLFSSMFLPRTIGFGLWALSLSLIAKAAGGSTRFEDVGGMAQKLPFAVGGLAVASLTLGGLPLLALFPIHQVLLEQVAQQSLLNALWILVGSGGMLFSAFRALAVLAGGRFLPNAASESRLQIALLVIGAAGLFIIGVFPQVFLPILNGLGSRYSLLP